MLQYRVDRLLGVGEDSGSLEYVDDKRTDCDVFIFGGGVLSENLRRWQIRRGEGTLTRTPAYSYTSFVDLDPFGTRNGTRGKIMDYVSWIIPSLFHKFDSIIHRGISSSIECVCAWLYSTLRVCSTKTSKTMDNANSCVVGDQAGNVLDENTRV